MTDAERLETRIDALLHATAVLLAGRLHGQTAARAALACQLFSTSIGEAPQPCTNGVRERRAVITDTLEAVADRALAMATLVE